MSTAQALIFGDIGMTVRALVTAIADEPRPVSADPRAATHSWATAVQRLDDLAWKVLDDLLAAPPSAGFSEAAAVRATITELVPGSVLMLGNSLPIREVDALCPGALAQVDVLSQRGASGIDGLIAGAAGAATELDRPLTLLIGDISALHDLSALPLLLRARVPVTVVVLQNHGGRIFEQAPPGAHPRGARRPAAARPLYDPACPEPGAGSAAVRAFLCRSTRRSSAAYSAPPSAVARFSQRTPGHALIEAIVPPSSAADHQRAYFAALTTALTRYREPAR